MINISNDIQMMGAIICHSLVYKIIKQNQPSKQITWCNFEVWGELFALSWHVQRNDNLLETYIQVRWKMVQNHLHLKKHSSTPRRKVTFLAPAVLAVVILIYMRLLCWRIPSSTSVPSLIHSLRVKACMRCEMAMFQIGRNRLQAVRLLGKLNMPPAVSPTMWSKSKSKIHNGSKAETNKMTVSWHGRSETFRIITVLRLCSLSTPEDPQQSLMGVYAVITASHTKYNNVNLRRQVWHII